MPGGGAGAPPGAEPQVMMVFNSHRPEPIFTKRRLLMELLSLSLGGSMVYDGE